MAKLKEKLEWLGGIAVVASLLLVAYEIRQNTNTVSAQALYDLNESGKEMLLILATDAELARLFKMGDSDPDALNSEEWYRYRMYVWANLNMYESAWDFHRRGIIGEGFMEGTKLDYCQKSSQPGWWRAMFTLEAWEVTDFLKSTKEWCVPDK